MVFESGVWSGGKANTVLMLLQYDSLDEYQKILRSL